jgi:hypothetical protein
MVGVGAQPQTEQKGFLSKRTWEEKAYDGSRKWRDLVKVKALYWRLQEMMRYNRGKRQRK